jgi:glucosamine--fructose-6-phosphate aminotransferase (isomerizing)
MPVVVDVASEFRYRNPVLGPGDLVIGITQSGETADTLAAMRLARDRGATVLAITNVMGSQATRDADGVLFTRAGLEVVGRGDEDVRLPGRRDVPARAADGRAARHAGPRGARRPRRRGQAPARATSTRRSPRARTPSRRPPTAHCEGEFFLYIGRHAGVPVALEGALKLKEISYTYTDAYAGREMKHGPIALLDQSTPVVAVATDSPVLEKLVSNMQEVRARGAHVIAVASEGNVTIGEHAEQVIRVPQADWMLQPLLAVIPLQLLAYGIARRRGLNVDQPRNLAKTVTVE